MTLKRYAVFAILAFLMGLVWLTLGMYHALVTPLVIGGVMVFFAPTIVAVNRRLKHRLWIVFFNLFCFPISVVMVLLDQPEC